MHTIALVTQKGGAGKTALASSLAVAAAEAGKRVIAIDLDEQASLTEWGKDRARSDRLQIGSLKDVRDLPELLAALAEQGFDLAILDLPGKHDTATTDAIKAADFALIPARPSRNDISAAIRTVRAVAGLGRPFGFVLNQCLTGSTARVRAAAEALSYQGPVAEPFVGLRVDFQDATMTGQGVTELAPEGKAAGEIRRLLDWILTRLQKEESACLAAKTLSAA